MKQGTPQTMSQIVALHMQQLPVSILIEPSPLNDIGTILDPTKSIETICLAVSTLLLLLLILAILIAIDDIHSY